MRVVISTVGRFHLFALARQLDNSGVLERIYTGFPWRAVRREGVPRQLVVTYPWIRPAVVLANKCQLAGTSKIEDKLHQLSVITLDRYVASKIAPGIDVFVGHEAAGLRTGMQAKNEGAIYVCDRGCSHIGYRQALLAEEYDRLGMKQPAKTSTFERELAEYEAADLIVVPSTFAMRSFIAKGLPAEKLAMVPYGAELEMGVARIEKDEDQFNVLFAGGLSVRKGAPDLLSSFQMIAGPGRYLHIAGVVSREIWMSFGDLLRSPNIVLHGHLDKQRLNRLMQRSDALVLPSIEDGFGMVIAEALSCGCPVIASEHTGGPDIVKHGHNGFIVPIRSPDEIASYLLEIAENRDLQRNMSENAVRSIETIGGWNEYGRAMIGSYKDALSRRYASFN